MAIGYLVSVRCSTSHRHLDIVWTHVHPQIGSRHHVCLHPPSADDSREVNGQWSDLDRDAVLLPELYEAVQSGLGCFQRHRQPAGSGHLHVIGHQQIPVLERNGHARRQ